jgi:hypothetical protein
MLDLIDKWLKERLSEEEDRWKLVESKATTLLTAAGLSVSFMTALGTIALPLLVKQGLPLSLSLVLAVLVCTVGLLGAWSAVAAAKTLKVSSTDVTDENVIVDPETLEFFSKESNKDEQILGYRIIRCRELLRLVHATPVTDKVKKLARAQQVFTFFIVSVLLFMLYLLL